MTDYGFQPEDEKTVFTDKEAMTLAMQEIKEGLVDDYDWNDILSPGQDPVTMEAEIIRAGCIPRKDKWPIFAIKIRTEEWVSTWTLQAGGDWQNRAILRHCHRILGPEMETVGDFNPQEAALDDKFAYFDRLGKAMEGKRVMLKLKSTVSDKGSFVNPTFSRID